MVCSRSLKESLQLATRPYLIEIVGVAGSGKSTLTNAVLQARPDFHRASPLRLRSPGHFHYAAKAVPALVPLVARRLARTRRIGWTEIKLVIYLEKWDRYLARESGNGGGVVIADQGPIYSLARLATIESPHPYGESTAWRDRTVRRWSDQLATIIWLDAPDRVLWERINGRGQDHETKGGSRAEADEFLRRYRLAFDGVMDHIAQFASPTLLRFDTSTESAARIAEGVLECLESWPAD